MKLTANIQGCGLGWVDLDFEYSTVCLILLGPNQSQPGPTQPRSTSRLITLCLSEEIFLEDLRSLRK